MKRNQWKDQESLEQIQEEKLGKLLSYARSNVPYYKKHLAQQDVRGLDALQSIPILDKRTVRKQGDAFLSVQCREEKLLHKKTSGSTGTPLDLYFNYHDCVYGNALRHHILSECGFTRFSRLVNLTTDRIMPPFQGLLYRVCYIPISEDESKALETLKRLKPAVTLSHPSQAVILARLNAESDKPLGIRSMVMLSEQLSDLARAEIEKSFCSNVRNWYGARESWGIAWECEKGGMHVCSDSVIMEIVDKEGHPVKPGQEGEVILTSLWNRTMPFIRYRVGDRAALGGSCSCGRGLPVLKKLSGRDDDLVVLPSGRIRSLRSLNITRTFALHEKTLSFMLIQENEGLFVVKSVPCGKGLSEKDKKQIEDRIKAGCLGEEVSVEFEEVSAIPKAATGKLQKFLSKPYRRRQK